MYVGRLAPSPTGRIHLGIARTSLAAWLDARAAGGVLLLRIEDIDTDRCVKGAADDIMRDLEWLGLSWDYGPDTGGPHAPYTQSERTDRYLAALDVLGQQGRTFLCTCSRKEIALTASAPHGPSDEGPRYPGTCRDAFRPRPGRNPAVRLRTELGDVITHHDRALGALDQDVHAAVGDFILRRTDGLWAYQLAVTVDDLAQGVTTIIRGADLAGSTPRQLLLRRLLDADAGPVDTLHVPLMLGEDGQRLAKRSGSTTVAAHREAGRRPEAVLGELATGLGLVPEGVEVGAEALVEAWRKLHARA
ncbi:MAG: tRNA glutamyl-Q(34) synthetase GluQRS [Deltaproteobacteria bacterium]|nr:tRNA glutamyl-Q(34) synthetase GluQRS [Deltaproteobacteria bacterium]